MKAYIRLIFLFFLFLVSSFSNSKELKFEWKLEHSGNLLLKGIAKSSTQQGHGDILMGCHDSSCIACTGYDFSIYEVVSSTQIDFIHNNPDLIISEPFSTLLGNCLNNISHRFNTHYTLRGQTTTTSNSLALLISCICCFPCFLGYDLCIEGRSHQNELSKFEALRGAVPNNLPEHVTISKRSLSHSSVSNGYQTPSSLNTEDVAANIHIFDIFLNTPETQQWVLDNLNESTNLTLELIIPELFSTASSAQVLVQQQSSENNNESMSPSHFITLNINNGITVLYHLNQSSTNDIQVLAIVVSFNDYTLTLTIDNHDVVGNQPPPPHYSEVSTTCNCGGACACANFEKNDTDDSDERNGPTGSHLFFPPSSY